LRAPPLERDREQLLIMQALHNITISQGGDGGWKHYNTLYEGDNDSSPSDTESCDGSFDDDSLFGTVPSLSDISIGDKNDEGKKSRRMSFSDFNRMVLNASHAQFDEGNISALALVEVFKGYEVGEDEELPYLLPTFRHNLDFIRGELSHNILDTVTLLREENNAVALLAVVEARIDCFHRNIETLLKGRLSCFYRNMSIVQAALVDKVNEHALHPQT
jgi:hypothetical protein